MMVYAWRKFSTLYMDSFKGQRFLVKIVFWASEYLLSGLLMYVVTIVSKPIAHVLYSNF